MRLARLRQRLAMSSEGFPEMYANTNELPVGMGGPNPDARRPGLARSPGRFDPLYGVPVHDCFGGVVIAGASEG